MFRNVIQLPLSRRYVCWPWVCLNTANLHCLFSTQSRYSVNCSFLSTKWSETCTTTSIVLLCMFANRKWHMCYSIAHMPFPIGGPLEPSLLSLTVPEIFNVKCNATVDVTLIRPLNKGQGLTVFHFGTSRFLIYEFV